ncbi:MAG: iron-siderophore ABC transporter substrate-binding protein [Richelia sp. RM2_1_2]|nr:iron-siderophore ABC transporter substrate-binding protein [Richelia sp. SM1_7_0]NJN09039.1 iron-siderophore ABC transporter substrate-binding protein [Richelia sp. RM1_1_1]NJO57195.1 iron-siderophore ABC transporter substrate-binding protein [Richelia sp. RM2_1_2]
MFFNAKGRKGKRGVTRSLFTYIFDSRQIKLFLFSILTALIVIGCGINTTGNFSSNTQNTTSQTRVVKHAMGETKVPLNPKRVVVLGGLDHVLALGIKPIAATTLLYDQYPNYLQSKTEEIQKVGVNGSANLEKILYLKPDLILGLNWDADLYQQLSQIAPTVLADGDKSWKEWLTKFAQALGETEKAEKLLLSYEQRINTLRQKMGNNLSETQVSLVNFWNNYTRIYMNDSFAGSIIKEIGLPRPNYQDKDKNSENISLELIPQLEGDVIFLILGEHNPSKLKQFTNHPLWSKLEAVREERVYKVSSDTWISSWGMIGANLVLDDLFKYLPL